MVKNSAKNQSELRAINFAPDDLNRCIYHTLPTEYLFELFRNKTLSLSRPSDWQDSYENVFLSQRIAVGSERVGIGFKNQFFGQCWSLCKESDAIWRLYGDDARGAKIATRVSSLLRVLRQKHHFSFVGKVRYLLKDALRDEVKEFISNGEWNFIGESQLIGPAKTLLAKRVAFKHEQEVRAIVFDENNLSRNEKRFAVEIDPNELIEQITFGPRLEHEDFRAAKEKIRALGFRGKIIRSSLYDPPKF